MSISTRPPQFRNFELTKTEWADVAFLARILRLESGKSPWQPSITFDIDDSEEGKEWKKTFASPEYVGAIVLERLETWSFDLFGWKLEVQTLGMHVLNNARVKFNKKLRKYVATNTEKELSFLVKEVVGKRIVTQPVPVPKVKKLTLDDVIED